MSTRKSRTDRHRLYEESVKPHRCPLCGGSLTQGVKDGFGIFTCWSYGCSFQCGVHEVDDYEIDDQEVVPHGKQLA